MTPTPDPALAARMAAIKHSDMRMEVLEDAYRSGQLITLADHTAAVQAAVAKAVEDSIKPLVWAEDTCGFYGKGYFGVTLRIGKRDSGFHIDTNAGFGATLKTLEAAKAFYQREYAEYVLAAFDTAIRARKGDAM